MNRKSIFFLTFGLLLIIAIILAFIFRSSDSDGNAAGTMAADCPVRVYQIGEPFNSPCELRPDEECGWYDPNNCEFVIRNVGEITIYKGQHTQVFKSVVKGSTQYLEIHIIEIQ